MYSTAPTVPVGRPVQVCESKYLICPRCGRRLHRVHPHNGTAFAICEARPPYTEGRKKGDRCGQPVLLLAMPQGVTLVVGINYDELTELRSDSRAAVEIFRSLGGIFPPPPTRSSQKI